MLVNSPFLVYHDLMKISGKDVADAILEKLKIEIKKKDLHPSLAIILANNNPASKIYVDNKIRAAERIGVKANLYNFLEVESKECIKAIKWLNNDPLINGIIVQYPVYPSWNFDDFENSITPKKDVDGFLENSPYIGATALAIWEMLTAFAYEEGFKKTEDFLKDKKIIVLGKGKTAGGPVIRLLKGKGFSLEVVDKETKNPDEIIKKADVIISATGVKNIINKDNLKKGSYVIGVGVGKELVDGENKTYGDINEEDVDKLAKLYCPTIGGIGPLTIVSLLKNVVQSAQKVS